MISNMKVVLTAITTLFFSVFADKFNLELAKIFPVNKQLIDYIVNTELQDSSIFGNDTTLIVTDSTPETSSMIRMILERISLPIIIFSKDFPSLSLVEIRPRLTYIFLKDKDEFEEILKELLNSDTLKVNIPIALIICVQMTYEEEQEIPKVLRSAWSYGFQRVIAIYITERIHVKRFNPFTKEIKEVPPVKSIFFDNQMRNLHGYKLRVTLFEEWPILKKDINWLTYKKTWIGRDVILLDNIVKLMNATYKVVEPRKNTRYQGAINDILKNQTDFCFVRHFQANPYEGIEFNEFSDIANLQILVPKPEVMNKSKAFLKILDKNVWTALIMSLCLLVVYIKMVIQLEKKYFWDISSLFLDIWSVFLGVSMYRFRKYDNVLKMSVLFWIWSSLVLNVSFQSRLMDQMEFIEYEHQISTLQDLKHSRIPIYSSYNVTDLTGHASSIKDQLIKVNYTDVHRLLWYQRPKAAFVVSFGMIRGNINPDLLPRNASISHVMMSEPLAFSYSVYLFRKNSPFTGPIGIRILEQRQFGFASRILQKVRGFETEEYEGLKKLSLRQVEAPFLIFIFGVTLCCAVFFGELIYAN